MKKYIKEPFPALSHLVGLLLSVAGLIVLIQASGSDSKIIAVSAVYGMSLILLYLASTLNHGIHCSEKTALHFELFDYAAIFLLIAGTYTPICSLMIKGDLGLALLCAEWSLAIIGIWSVIRGGLRSRTSHVAVYLLMGWLFVLGLRSIMTHVPRDLLYWLFGGALFYSVGSIIFILDSRNPWKGRIKGHDVWHVMVLSGSTCHFVVIHSFIENIRW